MKKCGIDVQSYLSGRTEVVRTTTGKKGTELICECIFCGKYAKLYINEYSGLYICYAGSCGASGNIVDLIAEIEGWSIAQALEYVRNERNKRTARSIASLQDKRKRMDRPLRSSRDGIIQLPPSYIPIKGDGKVRIHPYLESRGIDPDTAGEFDLGYCTEGKYAGRIIFPIVENGEVIAFQARTTRNSSQKYLNPPGFKRMNYLYGHDLIQGEDTVVVVEGPTDVIGMRMKGFPAAAILGKVVSHRQASKILKSGVKSAVLMFDGGLGDEIYASARILSLFLPTTVAQLPDGLDPFDAPRERIVQSLKNARPLRARDLRIARSV